MRHGYEGVVNVPASPWQHIFKQVNWHSPYLEFSCLSGYFYSSRYSLNISNKKAFVDTENSRWNYLRCIDEMLVFNINTRFALGQRYLSSWRRFLPSCCHCMWPAICSTIFGRSIKSSTNILMWNFNTNTYLWLSTFPEMWTIRVQWSRWLLGARRTTTWIDCLWILVNVQLSR